MSDSILVRKIDTGATYRLWKRPDNSYYLSANDGMVPSGQVVNGPLSRVLTDFRLEVFTQ